MNILTRKGKECHRLHSLHTLKAKFRDAAAASAARKLTDDAPVGLATSPTNKKAFPI